MYDAVDINVYQANMFHTKMLIKERSLQNYLFNTDVYELPPKERLEISGNLRREMIEIFSGRNIYPWEVNQNNAAFAGKRTYL
jgi:S-adenosylmethionine decarboxylase